jgi:predicted DNA-binding transcriptional regulator AlpA
VTEQLMDVDALGVYLGGVAPGTIYQWRHRGYGPRAIRVGGALRWRPSDVDAWLEAQAEAEAVKA